MQDFEEGMAGGTHGRTGQEMARSREQAQESLFRFLFSSEGEDAEPTTEE